MARWRSWPGVLAARGQRVLPRRIVGLVRGAGGGVCAAQNPRLKRSLAPELERARQECERTGQAARVFKDFRYRTLDSWSRERRVIGKAEHLPRGANPRFVVTSLGAERMAARALYEEVYCARGDMENRIKEQQLALFADRTSAQTMRANQLRLYFASFAYALLECGAGACRARGWRGRNAARSA